MKTTDPKSTFPEWLQTEMISRNLKAADMERIAKERGIEVTAASIGNILNRKRGLGIDVARAIAVVFGVSEDQIFTIGGLQTERSGTITIEEDEMLRVFRDLSSTDRKILMDTGKIMNAHRTASREHRRENVSKKTRREGDVKDISKPDSNR